jgi:hypothetical protein
MLLNLAEKNPSRLLATLQSGLEEAKRSLRIELLGPGMMLHDTALMLFHELRSRPSTLRLHIHSHTCLLDGAILVWLAGDTRTIRPDAWIQIGAIDEFFPTPPESSTDYPSAIAVLEESPAETDLRTIHRHLDEFLPVPEIAGLRLFEPTLSELHLLSRPGAPDPLAHYFNPDGADDPTRPEPNSSNHRSGTIL